MTYEKPTKTEYVMRPSTFITLAHILKAGRTTMFKLIGQTSSSGKVDISVPNMSGILKRLKKRGFITSDKERGKRGDPANYQITQLGYDNFKITLNLYKHLVAVGDDHLHHYDLKVERRAEHARGELHIAAGSDVDEQIKGEKNAAIQIHSSNDFNFTQQKDAIMPNHKTIKIKTKHPNTR